MGPCQAYVARPSLPAGLYYSVVSRHSQDKHARVRVFVCVCIGVGNGDGVGVVFEVEREAPLKRKSHDRLWFIAWFRLWLCKGWLTDESCLALGRAGRRASARRVLHG